MVNNKLPNAYSHLLVALNRTILLTLSFLIIEIVIIIFIYHNNFNILKDKITKLTNNGDDVTHICGYVNCNAIVNEGIYYRVTEGGLIHVDVSEVDVEILFSYLNRNLDTVITIDGNTYVVSNSNTLYYINKLLISTSMAIFIIAFFIILKLRISEVIKDNNNRDSLKNDLEAKLQRDLTESLHHEMGTPLAIIKTLTDEILKNIYPCDLSKNDNVCLYKVKGIEDESCKLCISNNHRRKIDNNIVNYYDQIMLAVDTLTTLQNLIGKSKKINYSNGNVSIFEIINNVILSSNQFRIKKIAPTYTNKGLLDVYSCRGINNGEMLIIFNNMTLNSIEANASKLFISAEVKKDMLELTIADNGSGIRDINNNVIKDFNIFNYGYSTKNQNSENIYIKNIFIRFLYKIKLLTNDNEFRGAGLSLCRNILKKNGGDIVLIDTTKNGTTFKLIIPTKQTHKISEASKYLS